MARGHLFWHVPHWFSGAPAATAGILSTGSDVVAALVDEHDNQDLGQDNFVVERIIGQYQVTTNDVAGAVDRYIHSRVYVCQADDTTLSLRDLTTVADADSSFLWANVQMFRVAANSTSEGSWLHSGGAGLNQPATERNGTFDIRVGRRVEEGTALVFHTQCFPLVLDNELILKLWVRVLLREA